MTHEEILTTLGHYVDYLIAGSTAEAPLWNIEKVRSGKPNKWNYIDGCMITACLSLYKTTGDEKFLDFSKKFLDYFVKDNGVIETYDPAEYNLDNVNQGKNLFTLYDLTGNQRYRDAIETIRGQLETQPRTKEGNFWHKKIYPNQVWLDGTYMAQPFYMEYETRCNGMHGCIDSYKQFMNIQKHMKDAKTGLYYHGYDESREMYWANPETGCSANFWLRAMGWLPGGHGRHVGADGQPALLRVPRHHGNAEGRGGRDDRLPATRQMPPSCKAPSAPTPRRRSQGP